MRRFTKYIFVLLLAISLFGGLFGTSLASAKASQAERKSAQKYASIIIDADSLEILHARNIDQHRYPASLTKMMTLYLTFDALERREISLDEALPISKFAAQTPPMRLGLKAGQTITVEQAIQALIIRSANDVAVVLAERLGGSEHEFAEAMTAKAHSLGMQSSVFQNPHGLPNPNQVTTARDMAKLSDALLRNHRKYYPYFSRQHFTYHGQRYKSFNRLLGSVKGVDGFKTGYTNASGYNLVISAKRDQHRIIAIVMGGASGLSRDKHMAQLLERGFEVIQNKKDTHVKFALKADENKIIRKVLPVPTKTGGFQNISYKMTAPKPVASQDHVQVQVQVQAHVQGWAIQIGAYADARHAQHIAQMVLADPQYAISGAFPLITPVQRSTGYIYRARLLGFTQESATKTCNMLAAQRKSCLVVAP